MTTGPRLASTRYALLAACSIAVLAAILATVGDSAKAGAATGGPDVTVFNFTDIGSYGSAGGFAGYAIGTTSCNRGDTPLNWCDQSSGCAPGATPKDHPVIAQNLYRLKNGRFQQIGMSWLKHGFLSLNQGSSGCNGSSGQSCTSPPAGGNQLGIGCTDPYTSGLNGSRPLGRRSEVNASTGVFTFPYTTTGASTVYDQRIKVATTDVDSTLNPGATFWAEAQYIASDDATFGNSLNNASYRQVTVGASPNFSLSMTGSFFEQQPAIFAWPVLDPTVRLVKIDIPGSSPLERFNVARKVTDLGGGLWHYEYAVHNLNSDRSARAFTVELPVTTAFTNVGFHDIEHHSGEPFATDDWTVFSSGGTLSWSTDTFATNPNANALRFATMFNFWFDADQPPTGADIHTIDLFKPGSPSSIQFTISDELFGDSFETGDTSAWSGATVSLRSSARRR